MGVLVRRVVWNTNPFVFLEEPTMGIRNEGRRGYFLYIDKIHLHYTEINDLKEKYDFEDVPDFDTIGMIVKNIEKLVEIVKEIAKFYGIKRVVCVGFRREEYIYLKGTLEEATETEEEDFIL